MSCAPGDPSAIQPEPAPELERAKAQSCACELPHTAPLTYGPDVTLSIAEHTIRLQAGNAPAVVHLPLAASVAGHRWTVKMWGSDANEVMFLPATDSETGLMDSMNDIDGDSLLETSGVNPAIVLEAYVDEGDDGPLPGWMVISR